MARRKSLQELEREREREREKGRDPFFGSSFLSYLFPFSFRLIAGGLFALFCDSVKSFFKRPHSTVSSNRDDAEDTSKSHHDSPRMSILAADRSNIENRTRVPVALLSESGAINILPTIVKDPRSRSVTLFSLKHVAYNSLREGDHVDKGSAVSFGQSRKEISSFNDTGCSPDKRYAKDDK